MNTSFLDYVRSRLARTPLAEFEAVSTATGVPLSTIRKLHYGEVQNPRVATVQKLYDHFKRSRAPRKRVPAARKPRKS